MSKRNQVSFTKPEEPTFLKQFKITAGYKEGPSVEDKREEPRLDPNNLDDRANEQPLIVTLNPGDLTAEEVDAIAAPPLLSQDGVNTCRDLPSSSSPAAQDSSTILENKKILFKQPSKRPAAEETNGAEAGKEKEVRRQKPESAMKKVSDSRLLSFADSEDG